MLLYVAVIAHVWNACGQYWGMANMPSLLVPFGCVTPHVPSLYTPANVYTLIWHVHVHACTCNGEGGLMYSRYASIAVGVFCWVGHPHIASAFERVMALWVHERRALHAVSPGSRFLHSAWPTSGKTLGNCPWSEFLVWISIEMVCFGSQLTYHSALLNSFRNIIIPKTLLLQSCKCTCMYIYIICTLCVCMWVSEWKIFKS